MLLPTEPALQAYVHGLKNMCLFRTTLSHHKQALWRGKRHAGCLEACTWNCLCLPIRPGSGEAPSSPAAAPQFVLGLTLKTCVTLVRDETTPTNNSLLSSGPSLPHILEGLVSLQAVLAEGAFPTVTTGWAVLGRIIKAAQWSKCNGGHGYDSSLLSLSFWHATESALEPPGLLDVLPAKQTLGASI